MAEARYTRKEPGTEEQYRVVRAASNTLLAAATAAGAEGLHGIHIVPASIGCFYPPAIESQDQLRVDFNCRQFHGDGLYLVEEVQGGRVIWRGARRFQRTPQGLHLDHSGAGEYMAIPSVEAIGWRIVGQVLEVFKSAQRIDDPTADLWRSA